MDWLLRIILLLSQTLKALSTASFISPITHTGTTSANIHTHTDYAQGYISKKSGGVRNLSTGLPIGRGPALPPEPKPPIQF